MFFFLVYGESVRRHQKQRTDLLEPLTYPALCAKAQLSFYSDLEVTAFMSMEQSYTKITHVIL